MREHSIHSEYISYPTQQQDGIGVQVDKLGEDHQLGGFDLDGVLLMLISTANSAEDTRGIRRLVSLLFHRTTFEQRGQEGVVAHFSEGEPSLQVEGSTSR